MSLLETLETHSRDVASQQEQERSAALASYRELVNREARNERSQKNDAQSLLWALSILDIAAEDFAGDVQAVRQDDHWRSKRMNTDQVADLNREAQEHALAAEQAVRKSLIDLIDGLPFQDLQAMVSQAQITAMGGNAQVKHLETRMLDSISAMHQVRERQTERLRESNDVPWQLSRLHDAHPRIFGT